MDSMKNFDVVVIGGGWSGILSCKYAIENGLSVVMLEKREGLGGVWRYSEDKNIATVLKSTYTTSSSTLTEMSDYPMPEEIGEFPYHEDVLTYLESYCKEFNLYQHFKFNCGVEKVTKNNEYWQTQTNQGEIITSKFLIHCTGLNQKRNEEVKSTIFKDFKGDIHHSGDFKEFSESHRNKNVLIFGGGETAADFVELWRCNANRIIWSIPNGQKFIRKCVKISPVNKAIALDKAATRLVGLFASRSNSSPGQRTFLRWLTNGSLLAYDGHGIPEYKTSSLQWKSFLNKQGHVLRYIEDGSVIPKRSIDNIKGKEIKFNDGSVEMIDVVILCSGFKMSFDLLPCHLRSIEIPDCYKMCLFNDDPTLGFVGYVRPSFGSIPYESEIQARFITRHFAGKFNLICKEDRRRIIIKDKMFWKQFYPGTSGRIRTLVDPTIYADDLASIAGFFPDYRKLLLRNPIGFMTAIMGPISSSFFRIGDSQSEAKSIAIISHHHRDNWSNIYIFLYVILRLLFVDFILDNLINLKFWCQTCSYLKPLKDLKATKVIDTIWKIPKRIFFDNVTRNGRSN